MTELSSPLAEPPAAITAPCDVPTQLPNKAMSAGDVIGAWGADRAALDICGARHQAETEFYRKLKSYLAGDK